MDGDDYRERLRFANPKRLKNSKLFRNRVICKKDNLIMQTTFVETHDGEKFDISEEDFHRLISILDNDDTDLNCHVAYSMKKKKRWLMPDQLQTKLPSFEVIDFPFNLKSVSLNRMYRHRAEIYFPFIYGFFYNSCDLRRIKGQTRLIYAEKEDGSAFTHIGRVPSFTPFLKDKEEILKDNIHVQYQTVELEDVLGLSNSHKFECSCCHGFRKPPAEMEPHVVGKDIPRTGHLHLQDNNVTDEEYSNDEDDDNDNSSFHRRPFLLGDFTVNRASRKRKSRKSCNSDNWVIL